MAKVSFIIPCFNNAANLPVTFPTLQTVEKDFPNGTEFQYVMVDDGSADDTWQAILKCKQVAPEKVTAIKLAGNVGSYNAFLAGMNYATGDCHVHMHADLQDPPELVPQMLDHWQKGNKFIIAHRTDRNDPFFSKLTGSLFHKIFRKIGLTNGPDGGFDLMLFDEELRQHIVIMNEQNAHQVYLFLWMNYSYVAMPYERKEREIGTSQWKFRKKLKLMVDTIVGFSNYPIGIIGWVGILVFIWASFQLISSGFSLITIVLLCTSLILLSLWVIGQYLWRTLDATRNRPNFIVDKTEL